MIENKKTNLSIRNILYLLIIIFFIILSSYFILNKNNRSRVAGIQEINIEVPENNIKIAGINEMDINLAQNETWFNGIQGIINNTQPPLINANNQETNVDYQSDDDFKWNDCACEKTFQKEYPIVWSGEVTASFVSGEAVGVRKFDKNAKYKQFYVTLPEEYFNKVHGNIRVTGRLIGITCAYANTIFGECVADVEADSVEKIN